tara:strand:+ start:6808 stop:7275 length:468 start_codon:yes stop_codon:yes gene_type:complete
MADDPLESWSLVIGQYITQFALIEQAVYKALTLLPQDRLTKHACQLRDYHDRVRFLQALLRSAKWPETSQLIQLLESTFPLASIRNQLAHNPTYINVELSEEHLSSVERPSLYHSKTGHELANITPDEIIKHKAQVVVAYLKIHTILQKWSMKDA